MDRKGVKVFASTNNDDMNIHTHMCIYLYIRKNFRSGVANSKGPRMVHILIDTIKLPFKWLHQFILPLTMYQMAYSSHPWRHWVLSQLSNLCQSDAEKKKPIVFIFISFIIDDVKLTLYSFVFYHLYFSINFLVMFFYLHL